MPMFALYHLKHADNTDDQDFHRSERNVVLAGHEALLSRVSVLKASRAAKSDLWTSVESVLSAC